VLTQQGEEGSDVLEGDIATCNVHVSLERLRASAAMRTPFFPGTKDEGWWLMVADVSSNAILAVQKVQLKTKTGLTRFVAASKSAAQGAATGVGQAGAVMPEEGGQRVSLKFRAPPPGAYQLQARGQPCAHRRAAHRLLLAGDVSLRLLDWLRRKAAAEVEGATSALCCAKAL
jgi:hypothetical protein